MPNSQITRLQQIQNSLARAVVKAPKSSHITFILRSLFWLKITEHIKYKLLSPSYLHNLITVQPPRKSPLVTLTRPSTSSSLRITDCSFQYALLPLVSAWNQPPASLRQPRTNHSSSDSPSPMSGTSSIGSIDSPISSFIIPHSSIPFLPFLPFLQILPTVAFLFFLKIVFTDSPGCLPI